MAKANITTGDNGQLVHTRTTAGSEESQVMVIGVDGVDTVIGGDATNGLDVDVTRVQGNVATKSAGTTGAQTNVSATVTANTTLIAADANRFGLTIFNDSASATLFVLMGAGTESATVHTIQIAPGGFWAVEAPMVTLRASGHWSAAVGAARITAVT